jgi:hypothetical protein
MILVNGIPKSGTHALLKAVQLLGIPDDAVRLEHLPFGLLPDGVNKHIYIIRHPRNVLVSYCRWQNRPVAAGMLIGFMRSFEGKSFADYWQTFSGWMTDPATFVVRYEALLANSAVIAKIAAYLGVPCLVDAFANIPGLTPTWTGAPSDWSTVWNRDIDAEWQKDCQGIQEAMGY